MDWVYFPSLGSYEKEVDYLKEFYTKRLEWLDRELYKLAFSVANEKGIPVQTKSVVAGGNDSGAIHITGDGVRTMAISVPCRYLHSPSCVADKSDIKACYDLCLAVLSEVGKL